MQYGIGGVIGILAGAVIATPAILLSLQKWATARMRVGIYDTEFNGRSVSTNAIIGWSVALSVPVVIAALVMLSIAIRNHRNKGRKTSSSPTEEPLNAAR